MAFPATPPDAENVFGGGISEIRVGGPSGTILGYTRGGLEVARSLTEFLSEVDQATAHLDARATMNEMFVRTTLADATLNNLAYCWNVAASAVTSSSSMQILDSADAEQDLVFVAPWASGETITFEGYRAFAQGNMTVRWARDADVDIPVEFRLLFDTSQSPSRFGDAYVN